MTPQELDAIRADHGDSGEVWDGQPLCRCGGMWPCGTIALLAEIDRLTEALARAKGTALYQMLDEATEEDGPFILVGTRDGQKFNLAPLRHWVINGGTS